jgi:hypothetical protein
MGPTCHEHPESLGVSLPWGFHDAYLERMDIDWANERLALTVRFMMSERQDMDQRALVTVERLVFCAIDPPEIDRARGYVPCPYSGLWIDAGAGAGNERAKARPGRDRHRERLGELGEAVER